MGNGFEPTEELLATIDSIQTFPEARTSWGSQYKKTARKREPVDPVDPYNRDPRVDMPGDRLARKRGRFPEREVSETDDGTCTG